MGGGASKQRRHILAEELAAATAIVDAETQDIVARDMARRKEKKMCLRLQVNYRGWSGRQRAMRQREVLVHWAESTVRHPHIDLPLEPHHKDDHFRRHCLRPDLELRWDSRSAIIREALEHRAAALIQAKVRGIQTRELNIRKQEAALFIQRRQRGKSARDYHGVKKRAATGIQAGWRGHLGRRRWYRHKLDFAVTVLQSVCRKWQGGLGDWRCIRSALLVQRRYRYIRLNGNWASAMSIRRRVRLSIVIQRMFRGFRERLRRKAVALETNTMVHKLLDSAGLSRVWAKWGDVFLRPGAAYCGVRRGEVGLGKRGDVPALRPDGLSSQLFGGWCMTYGELLELRDNQLGGMGLLKEAIPAIGAPKMPRVEWGMSAADRA